MNLREQQAQHLTRRHFLRRCNAGLGMFTMSSLLGKIALASEIAQDPTSKLNPMAPKPSGVLGKAKRIIYLDLSGAPPQHDLFDYKPLLNKLNGTPCPQ